MKIKIHEQNLTKISKILGTTPEECAAWVEELITDIEDSSDDTMCERLGENFPLEKVRMLTENLIEHFNKEHEVSGRRLSGLVYNLVTV